MSALSRPSQIQVGSLSFEINWSKDAINRLIVEANKPDAWGYVDYNTLLIHIDGEQPVQRQRNTLMHEVLHCIWHETGLDDVEEATEEYLIGSLTGRLVGVLRDNPELVAYLTHEKI